jgi:hypothetical protein
MRRNVTAKRSAIAMGRIGTEKNELRSNPAIKHAVMGING